MFRQKYRVGIAFVLLTTLMIGIITGNAIGDYVLSNTAHIKIKIKLLLTLGNGQLLLKSIVDFIL
ncbi:MAG: hypothetical protein ACFFB5_11710 [Promethearchaeota archaeon]